jgi:hypothetical protein
MTDPIAEIIGDYKALPPGSATGFWTAASTSRHSR